MRSTIAVSQSERFSTRLDKTHLIKFFHVLDRAVEYHRIKHTTNTVYICEAN